MGKGGAPLGEKAKRERKRAGVGDKKGSFKGEFLSLKRQEAEADEQHSVGGRGG
jgi:hypothetical protein